MDSATGLDRFLGKQEPHATFRDARLVAVSLDYRDRSAATTWELCVGDPDDSMRAVRERRRTGRLIFSGLIFWVIEPPKVLDARPGLLRLTESGPLSEPATENGRKLADLLPSSALGWQFLFADWDARIYCGCWSVTYEWL